MTQANDAALLESIDSIYGWSAMNEQQLRYLVAVVETGTFTAAAERCFIAQPSLSAAIAKLEREAGTPLFHRIGRTIRPTSACEALLPAARDAIRAADTARMILTENGAELSGVVDLTVQPTLVIDPAAALIAEFTADNPGVTVRVRSTRDGSGVVESVADGTSEIGIGDIVTTRGLTWSRLGEEHYVVVRPARSEPTPSEMRIQDLGEHRLVLPPPGSPTRSVIDDSFARARCSMNVAVEVEHREALIPLVRAGAGVSILPESMLDPVAHKDLAISLLVPRVRRRFGLVHRSAPLSPAAAAFKALARSSARRAYPDR